MLHTVVHNRINIYPLLYYGMECCSMPRASGGQDGSVVVFFYFSVLALMCPQSHCLIAAAHIFLRETDGCPLAVLPFFLCVDCPDQHWLVTCPPRQSIVPLINLKCSYIYRAIFWSKCDIASEILTHFMYF